MSRADAVQFTLELAAEWRRLGARVTFEPGWESRGNGTSANYDGAIVHHTGFGSSLADPNPARSTLIGGRPDLSGPLCNSTGPACADNDPWIHIIAAYPANHAGASGGKSMGPLPVTTLFNPRVWGHEIDYGGTTAMLPGQRTAALIVGRGVCNVLARSTEYVRAHAETSITGKWDPGVGNGTTQTIDMAAFRQDAANFITVEDDMTPDQFAYLQSMNGKLDRATNAAEGVWHMLKGSHTDSADRLTDLWAQEGVDAATIEQRLDALAQLGAPSTPTSGAAQPIDYAELAKHLTLPSAADIAAEVVKLQNAQARDGDPATGPVS